MTSSFDGVNVWSTEGDRRIVRRTARVKLLVSGRAMTHIAASGKNSWNTTKFEIPARGLRSEDCKSQRPKMWSTQHGLGNYS
jgi:hypothetical protein